MEIIIGKNAGFCFGVKNAVDNVENELKKDKNLFCLGELVHNKQVTESLIKEGVTFIENVKEAKGKIIIRAHGVTKETYEEIKKLDLEVKDLTCPKVLHIHNIAEDFFKKNYYIFLVGQKEHPETIGTISFCRGNASIIEDVEDIDKAIKEFQKASLEKTVVIAQTTISVEKYNKIVDILKGKIANLEVKNTICNATKLRQEETEEISKQVESMIIIGGKHSSNSNKLYDIAKKNCENSFFIETAEELNFDKIKKFNKIGIMAGASTPQKSIQDVVDIIRKIC